MKLPLTHSPLPTAPPPSITCISLAFAMFPFLLVATWRVFHALMRRHKLLWYLLSFPAIVVVWCCCTLANSCRTTAIRLFNSFAALPWLSAGVGVVVGVVCRRHFLLRSRQTKQRVASVRNSSQFAVLRADSSPTTRETLATPAPCHPVPFSHHSPLFVALAELDAALCTQFSTAATTMQRRR